VIDAATKQGLAGAQVRAAGKEATTDAEGRYRLDDLTAGEVTVEASKAGFEPASVRAEVRAGETAAGVDLALRAERPRTGRIKGKVIDAETREGVSGATVTLGDQSKTTNVVGTFRFPDVPPGEHTLRIEAEGYGPQEVPVTVKAGEEADVGEVRLKAGGPTATAPKKKKGSSTTGILIGVLGAGALVALAGGGGGGGGGGTGFGLKPGWPQSTGDGVSSSPALGDLDGDGQLEVVVGSYDDKVYAWNGDGTLVPGWPKNTGGFVFSSPALGDLDGDGRLEVVVGSGDYKVYAWNGDGTPVPGWPQSTGDVVLSSPALGDLDGDGQLEVVVGSEDDKVYAWNGDGTPVPGWPQSTGYVVRSSPALGDVDGDGQLEVVVGSDDNKVYAWNGDGSLVPGWPQGTGYWVSSSPALGDLDGDGQLEVVVGSWDNNVYAWEGPPGSATHDPLPWPMFHHDRHHTGLVGYSPGSRAAAAKRAAWQWTLQARGADGAMARAVLGAGGNAAAGRIGLEPLTLRLRGEGTARLLPERPRLEWPVTVESEGRTETVTLTWPDLSRVPGRYRLTLTDLDAGGKRVSLRTRTSYTYRPGPTDGPRHFLIVADATPRGALAITNLTERPGRGGELVSWCYTLTREAEVTARVETLAGRRIAWAGEPGSRGAGVNTLTWDGRDEQGRPVPNGVYLVRVVATTEEGESVQAMRTVRVER